uniref:SAC3/GANP/THP3 conserved domain-containing protein n=1 Tax=Trichobilharzia regenti TaxID=157069 RepID=A0AA85IX55_TRIRE|nr:unnamed protein product [Trichobilharzia regenti]
MAHWDSYGSYWQGAYPPYYDYTQPTKTYDYNHQTVPVPLGVDESSTPPPPGVESCSQEGDTAAVPTCVTPYNASWSTPAPFQSQGHGSTYHYPPYEMTAQKPAVPEEQYPYGPPVFMFQNQTGSGWDALGLLLNPQSNGHAVQSSGVRPNFGTPTHSTCMTVNGPLFPFRDNQGPSYPASNVRASNATACTPLSQEALKQPPASFQDKGAKEQWSDELKEYVQRAFCSIDTSEEKDQMERILKEKLEYIFRNNIKVDWKTENIPTIPSRAIASFRKSFGIRPNSVNVVRPVQLPGPRGLRPTGPRVSPRLPVGHLTKGGRNMFSSFVESTSVSKKLPSKSRSPSRSPVTKSLKAWRRKRSYRSKSSSTSKSPNSHHSSSSSSIRTKRYRRRDSRSHSGSRQTQKKVKNVKDSQKRPLPDTRGKSKSGQRKRGGTQSSADSSADFNISSQDRTVSRGRGRGNWRGKHGSATSKHTTQTESRLSQRASRFKDHLPEPHAVGSGSIARTTSQLLSTYTDEHDDLIADFGSCQIVGTMQEVEKQFLRLTRAPDPSEVRPLSVLKVSLENVREKWQSNADYSWACEQFKSIRQDLIVQGIEDDFAVSVYEAHADAALDAGDFEEFHQCQSQLLRLHKEGLGSDRLLEFTAYRLLYYIFTVDILGINTIMAGLRPTHKTNPCVAFALKLRSAWSLNNYHRFFKLLYPADEEQQPPLRCKQVVNWFIDRERREVIKLVFKVFRPTISLSFISNLAGFSSNNLCKDFICKEFAISEDSLEPLERMDTKTVWSHLCS